MDIKNRTNIFKYTKKYTFKYKKRRKDKIVKKNKLIVLFNSIKKYLLPLLIFSILIYFIFDSNPKNAWLSFNGKFSLMQLSGNVRGLLDAKIDSMDAPGGTISNFQPIIFEYDNKSIELKEDELKIEFHKSNADLNNTPLEFANYVTIHSRNAFITNELSISDKFIRVNGGEIYSGIKASLYDKPAEQLEGISWELSGPKGIEINTEYYLPDYVIFIKGVRLEDKEIKSHNIKIKSTFDDPYIRLSVDTNKPINFQIKESNDFHYTGLADNIIFFTSTNAALTFINSATPQVMQVPLTSVSIKRIKFEPKYNNNEEYLKDMENIANEIKQDFTLNIGDNSTSSTEKKEDYLTCLISGNVEDVSLSGKSLFPTFMQWVRYNSNTVTTILITSFISLMFALITRKE